MALQLLRQSCKALRNPIRFIATTSATKNNSVNRREMDELQKNPYFNKYAGKIDKLKSSEPDNFQAKLDALAESKQKPIESQSQQGDVEVSNNFSLPTGPKESSKENKASMRKQRTLSEYMRMELLADRDSSEISDIWRRHHEAKPVLSAVIPGDTFRKMSQRFAQFPTFLFPLPRQDGYEFFVVQFEGREAHITSLINYHAHKADAAECLTIIHYDELIDHKNIVLMLGEVDTNLLTLKEAQCLANQIELYYGRPDEAKLGLLEAFNKQPEEFNHQDLITQIEQLSL